MEQHILDITYQYRRLPRPDNTTGVLTCFQVHELLPDGTKALVKTSCSFFIEKNKDEGNKGAA